MLSADLKGSSGVLETSIFLFRVQCSLEGSVFEVNYYAIARFRQRRSQLTTLFLVTSCALLSLVFRLYCTTRPPVLSTLCFGLIFLWNVPPVYTLQHYLR